MNMVTLLTFEHLDVPFLRYWSPRYSYSKIVGREASLDVPEKVHFVWLGKVIPDKYLDNMKTFRNNTNYEVSLKET